MIKSFNPRHVFLVAKLQKQGVSLNLEERLIYPRSPLRSAILSNLLPTLSGVFTYILDFTDESEHYQGMVQTQIRPGRPELDVVFVSPTLEQGNGSHALWQRLLSHACVKAGEERYQHVYARVDNERDELQVFKNVGFTPYAEEHIFKLNSAATLPKVDRRLLLRKQTNADSWGLQRLYTAITPHAVQIAEGLAQGRWQIYQPLFGEQARRYGYVWENQGDIMAAMIFHSGKVGHWFQLMVHPDFSKQTDQLVLSGLRLIKNRSQQPVYCSIRSYQTELTSQLLDCGFESFAHQTVMVKHIAVRAKDFFSRLLPSLEGVVERKPITPTTAMQVEKKSNKKIDGNNQQPSGSFTI